MKISYHLSPSRMIYGPVNKILSEYLNIKVGDFNMGNLCIYHDVHSSPTITRPDTANATKNTFSVGKKGGLQFIIN